MQAALAVSEADHDEADIHDHCGYDLGKEPSCGAAKTNSISSFIRYFKPEDFLANGSLPGGTGEQRFIEPCANQHKTAGGYTRADKCGDHLRRWLAIAFRILNKREKAGHDQDEV